jgi:hypothetical protein
MICVLQPNDAGKTARRHVPLIFQALIYQALIFQALIFQALIFQALSADLDPIF